MSDLLRAAFGEPCHTCGFDWELDDATCRVVIGGAPAHFAALLAQADGTERHRDLSWSSGAYVAHVVDNTRIWAERVAAAPRDSGYTVAPYDQDALGTARAYNDLPLAGSLWSLGRAVGDWLEAEVLGAGRAVVLHHPEQGELTMSTTLHTVAHEIVHHAYDIERILAR